LFLWAYCMMGLDLLLSSIVLGIFGIASFLFTKKYGETLNGSADYVPAIVLLLVCGIAVWYRLSHPHLVIAGVLAAMSLVCRVIDHDVKLPSGTHFLWHMLNGFLMLMLTMFVEVYIEI